MILSNRNRIDFDEWKQRWNKANLIQINKDTNRLILNHIKETIIESISGAKYTNRWEKEID